MYTQVALIAINVIGDCLDNKLQIVSGVEIANYHDNIVAIGTS